MPQARRVPRSEQISIRARKRILGLVGKQNLGTDDPLMAEIALAQVDAILSVSQALRELREGFDGIEKVQIEMKAGLGTVTHHHLAGVNMAVHEMDRKLADLIITIDHMVNGGANATFSKEPWWAFWKKWVS